MTFACRSLLSLVIALAFCAPASAAATAKRACDLERDPSRTGNFFEPPTWPVKLEPAYYSKPGIVRPTHDHFYLFIAWRALAGTPLDANAQAQLAPFDPCLVSEANDYRAYDSSAAAALVAARAQWEAQRKAAGAGKPPTEGSNDAPNCHADAYRTAARTLESRLASYGKSAPVRDWLTAQDAVFATCTGAAPLPADAAADAPQWLRQDRAYQQAAAALYKGDYPDAARRFDAIAQDEQSPWRAMAPYLAARADLRSATGNKPDPAALERARARLAPLAESEPASPLRADARRLLQLVQLKSAPRDLLARLDAQLSGAVLPDTFAQDLVDFMPAYRAGEGRERRDLAFGSWLTALRGDRVAVALDQWHAGHQPAWLVAALTLARPDTEGLPQLLADAAAVAPDSPAYQSVRYHMARLAPDAAALKIVSATSLAALRTEDANAMRRAGLAHASTLAEVGHYLPRASAMGPVRANGALLPSVDVDGAILLNNGLPLDMLVTLSQMPTLAPALRNEIATVAWTRAFVLDKPALMTTLAPQIKTIFPAAATLVDAMLKETDPPTRRGAAAMLLARFPGMVGSVHADQFYPTAADAYSQVQMHSATARDRERVNWWCSFPERAFYNNKETVTLIPHFVTAAQRKTLEAERAELARTPNATDYLAQLVMEHAARYPSDERLPEALSRLIRGHGGCSQGKLTAAMFKHLHKHFKRSAAAKRTPTHR